MRLDYIEGLLSLKLAILLHYSPTFLLSIVPYFTKHEVLEGQFL